MKKKNGFVFVETIVVCAILAVSLVAIYASFALIISNQKRKSHYDQAIYNYRAYNVVKTIEDSAYICDNYEDIKSAIDSSLVEKFRIKKIYKTSIGNITSYPTSMDVNLIDYIKTLNPKSSAKCMIIFEFENDYDTTQPNKMYYSSIAVEEN